VDASRPIACVLLAIAALAAAPAEGAPVLRPATLELRLSLVGLDPIFYDPYSYVCYGCPLATVQAAGSVSVDPMIGRIGVSAAALTLGTPVVAGVDSTTALASITATRLSNLSGTFSVGGAAIGPSEPPCPVGPGSACVPQTAFGGVMGLTGTIRFHVVPNVVVIPVVLGNFQVGLGGSGTNTTFPASFDAAPWTVGQGRALLATTSGGTQTEATTGQVTASSIRLVTPVFVSTLGNQLPFFAELSITFSDGLGTPAFAFDTIPEPALLVLLLPAAAVVATAARTWRRNCS